MGQPSNEERRRRRKLWRDEIDRRREVLLSALVLLEQADNEVAAERYDSVEDLCYQAKHVLEKL